MLRCSPSIITELLIGQEKIIFDANGNPVDITEVDTYASVEFPEMLEGLFIKEKAKLYCLSNIAKILKIKSRELNISARHEIKEEEKEEFQTVISFSPLNSVTFSKYGTIQ